MEVADLHCSQLPPSAIQQTSQSFSLQLSQPAHRLDSSCSDFFSTEQQRQHSPFRLQVGPLFILIAYSLPFLIISNLNYSSNRPTFSCQLVTWNCLRLWARHRVNMRPASLDLSSPFSHRFSPFREVRKVVSALIFFLSLTAVHSIQTASFPQIGTGSITLNNTSVRTVGGDSSCIIVGCDSRNASDSDYWWHFYSKAGYVTTQIHFEKLLHNGEEGAPHWCRIPTVIRALQQKTQSRVLYVDTDTRVDVNLWCKFESLGDKAPIIVNSAVRNTLEVHDDYTVHGTQVQTNAFVASPGRIGIKAMRRWEKSYYSGDYQDQGAINKQEHGLCGVPGWMHCAANPHQQKCHCCGSSHGMPKHVCIKKLFEGTLKTCDLK